MRPFSPTALVLVALGLLLWPPGEAGGEDLYRADALRTVPAGPPAAVRLLPPETSHWPAPLLASLEERIRAEWPADRRYGPLQTGPRVWLAPPLLTVRQGDRVLVPAVEEDRVRVRGRLELPEPTGSKRVVLLIDASMSSNARTSFEGADGRVETISVLEAERRAVDHLVDQLEGDWLDFGVIAFGEGTWPVVEPGASVATVRERLAQFRREHPRGEGRTDTVCALWTAWDWLRERPEGLAAEIVLLTDGDMPWSGRFGGCRRLRGEARARCESRANQTVCPASRSPGRDGRSDLVQLERFARKLRRKLRVSPVVFEADRRASAYRKLAEATGGTFVQVASVQAIEVALPPLVAGRIRRVVAYNPANGATTGDLRGADGLSFDGFLPLVPGANDVELTVESDRGPAARFRFRVYAGRPELARYLAGLREGNRELEQRSRVLGEEAEALRRRRARRALEVATE